MMVWQMDSLGFIESIIEMLQFDLIRTSRPLES
jgi:hypothetical protein